jgi:hypothetical protein
VVVEVLAVVAVPLAAFAGARALLDTRAGTFLTGPGPTDPGFQALVDPSPVLPVVERRDGELTGITLLTRSGPDADGGAAVIVPAGLVVEGQTLAQWGDGGDAAAVDALSRALRLGMASPVVLDEDGWTKLLGERTLSVRSPDPVLVRGRERFRSGELSLGAADATDWLGLTGNQEPSALLFRRQLWWQALLDPAGTSGSEPGVATEAGTAAGAATEAGTEATTPGSSQPRGDGAAADPGEQRGAPAGSTAPPATTAAGDGAGSSGQGQPAATIDRIAAGSSVVEILPVDPVDDATMTLDVDAAEALVVEVVPFPAGGRPGDRLRVRVLDRTGRAGLDAVARAVARAGAEVVVVGNAGAFDDGPTEAVIADGSRDEAARRLLERLGTGTVTLSPGGDDSIDVTLLAGPDLLGLIQG